MTEGPLAVYRSRRGTGTLKSDPAQELAASKLQSLWLALRHYKPSFGHVGWRARLGLSRSTEAAPQGLYIYGDVGRGKSMLMDLFFETAPVEKKRRVHFHQFMLEIHARLHGMRKSASHGQGVEDALPHLASEVANEAWLLCFDEFHVTDIADAMILGRLFGQLFELGVIVVATSNWPPDDLYKDGLQRALFLPFITLLKQQLDVLHLAGAMDYRLERLKGAKVFHYPLGREASQALTRTFRDLTDSEGERDVLLVQERKLEVPRAAKGVAWFQFEELCARPLGAADFLAIATHFHTVLIDGVPRLKAEQRNEAKRFMILIDALYEHKVKAVIAADGPPESLYPSGQHGFEFQRTVSRLMEMQAEDYIAAEHLT